MSIAVVDGGTYYHHRALHGERYRNCFAEIIYILELPRIQLDRFSILVMPDRLHPGPLIAAREQIERYLAGGGTVVAFGESQAHRWLPGVTWSFRPTNFWWWKTPGAGLGLYADTPEHPLFQYVSLNDATWHYHGVLTPPPGATPIISVAGDGVLLYEDTVSTPGKLVVSSLDPFYHYGSHFMPVTERFLEKFLEWLKTSIGNPTK